MKTQLAHDQIAFIIESLEKRKEKLTGTNAMVDSYLTGVNEEVDELLSIITPCAEVCIIK